MSASIPAKEGRSEELDRRSVLTEEEKEGATAVVDYSDVLRGYQVNARKCTRASYIELARRSTRFVLRLRARSLIARHLAHFATKHVRVYQRTIW